MFAVFHISWLRNICLPIYIRICLYTRTYILSNAVVTVASITSILIQVLPLKLRAKSIAIRVLNKNQIVLLINLCVGVFDNVPQ